MAGGVSRPAFLAGKHVGLHGVFPQRVELKVLARDLSVCSLNLSVGDVRCSPEGMRGACCAAGVPASASLVCGKRWLVVTGIGHALLPTPNPDCTLRGDDTLRAVLGVLFVVEGYWLLVALLRVHNPERS